MLIVDYCILQNQVPYIQQPTFYNDLGDIEDNFFSLFWGKYHDEQFGLLTDNSRVIKRGRER